MAELLRSFDEPISDELGTYHARVVGRLADDGMWEAWLEFVPLDPTDVSVLTSGVESRQPAREHLAYWASGLSVIYGEGALQRARRPLEVRTRIIEEPLSHAPAPRVVTTTVAAVGPEAVLDPFEVGSRSLDVLGQELTALNRPRLLNIIAAYDLNPAGEDLTWMTDAQLARFIVVAVDTQLMLRRA
jgi:hypothetical protein